MIRIELGQQRITLQSGSTTVVLDKAAGTATLQRKVLFWVMKPVERPLSAIVEARIHKNINAGSRAEMYSTMLVFREGGSWVLSARDKQDASDVVAAMHEFRPPRWVSDRTTRPWPGRAVRLD
jgi:hypothetical protein